MLQTKRKDYDLIVSLGGSCNVASQLKFRGLRRVSLPLDWTGMFSEKPLLRLPDIIRTRFEGFCRYENMRDRGEPRIEHGKPTYSFDDEATGFRFMHSFHAPLEDRAAFDRERSVLAKRIERFYDMIGASRHVLFVLTTFFAFDVKLAEDILAAIREVFPSVDSEMVVVQFKAPGHDSFDTCAGDIHVETYPRPVDTIYDNLLTSVEWNWMDELALSGELPPGRWRRLLVKWKYKAWKALSKSLLKDGVARGQMWYYQIERGMADECRDWPQLPQGH